MLHEATTLEFKNQTLAPATEGVRLAGPLDERLATSIVRLGFDTDPFARWMYPDAASYMKGFSEFVRAVAARSINARSAHLSRNNSGAALWFSPGVSLDEEEIGEIVQTTVSPELRRSVVEIFEQKALFRPAGPHWYLPIIAVDPVRQGRGTGASLLRFAARSCDDEDLPAYLESSNPRNISLYQRFDFEIIGTIRSGGSPPLFPMLRKRRSDRSGTSRDINDQLIHETADMFGKEN
ncbi:MAG TPA: GNAT family N-acetyltransferase [Pyrinomonadaceae bacterium]|nr:GNAT family N-acetyltransferase [Pyrinomonadaceae bacterium]